MIPNIFQLLMKKIPDRLVTGLATLGPVGLWGRAPGTNGSVAGLIFYTLFFHQLGPLGQVIALMLSILFAVLICGDAELRLKKRDPGEIILDEVVAVPLCFLGLQPFMEQTGAVWLYMLGGFLLFRLFDIAKPLGINRLQRYPGGVGVVLDDLGAAIATNVSLRLAVFALQFGGWLN